MSALKRMLIVLPVLALAACQASDLSGIATPAQRMAATNDWPAAVKYYRDALSTAPDSPELRNGYLAVTERAVDFYVDRARTYSDARDFSNAEGILTRGLLVVPESQRLKDELERVDEMRRGDKLYRDALVESRLGRGDKAMGLLERSLSLDPSNDRAVQLFNQLIVQSGGSQSLEPIRLSTGAPVSINFRNAAFKDAALALGRAYGVNMIFDADLPDRQITVFAENVSFAQAFQLLLKSNKSFYRRLGRNSVIIVPDDPGKRAEYEDYVVRTFFLKSADAQEAADMLTRSLGLQTVSVNASANTLTVRDTEEKIALADRLLSVNDNEPAEMVLEVEILEVNRTKSEQLGLSFGSQISVTPPSGLDIDSTFPLIAANGSLNASGVTLPAATFRFFKQDVDARTLASPRIRTIDKREAQIHVGDQVPLRSATLIDSNGQTQTTFEYRDVGIKLNVTPESRLDGSVAVELKLEVSTLGQNLGTADEPAYAIGTRNVSTRMVLDDGETAIIGGLIRDEDRDTIQGLPGQRGATTPLGQLFRTRDGSNTRTDIILTLTPRVIRRQALPSVAEAQFFSGTGTQVTGVNEFDFLAETANGEFPTIQLDLSGSAGAARPASASPAPALPAPSVIGSASTSNSAVLSFGRASYETSVGETVDVVITASGFPESGSGDVVIRYRRDLVEALDMSTSPNLPFRIDNAKGEIRIELTGRIGGAATRDIARVRFRGVAPGLSYLIFANPVAADGPEGLPDNVQLQASRIVIR